MKKIIFIMAITGMTLFGSNKIIAQNNSSTNNESNKISLQSNSQNTVKKRTLKDSLKVSGLCESCKKRIEKAAKSIKGVSSAQWNAATNLLIYTYTGIVKKQDVSNAILKVGHDTELGRAPDDIYNALPACCKYR